MENESQRESPKRRSSEFATTHWSIVNAAGDIESAKRQEALADLCESYWYPLYSYARRKVAHQQQAEDLIQSFFAKLLEKNRIGSADVNRGRFRAFLITSLKHFISNEWKKQKAIKRGRDQVILAIDFQSGESRFGMEPATEVTAEQLFDRSWAITLLNSVLESLECDYSKQNKRNLFVTLKPFLSGEKPSEYSVAADSLGMSIDAVKMAVSRMRRKYRERLRDKIAQTVLDEGQIDDEIHDLFAALAL